MDIRSLVDAESRSLVSRRLLEDALGDSIMVLGCLIAVWIRYLSIHDDELDRLVRGILLLRLHLFL